MELSRPFQSIAIQFIDNWIKIDDSKKMQRLVLSCIRSLNSKMHLSDFKLTEMKTSFDWKSDWNLTKPIRVDKIGEELIAFKPNYAAIQKQEQKQRKIK